MSHADQMAALDRWLAEHPTPERRWDPIREERMAAAANGTPLRPMPVDRTLAGRGGRDVQEPETGYVRRNGVWSWEPPEDAA
jgi:hypothetical protein